MASRSQQFSAYLQLERAGTQLGSSGFGEITSARDPRIIQLGAKLIW